MEELEPKQRSKFVQLITDLLSKLKQKFSKSKEMLGEITRLENMFIETAKSVETKTVDNKTETQYSMYNEHASNIMQWEYSASTKTGDCKIFSVRGGFALIEATEDGYIELARGSYKEMKTEYERAYKEANNEIYGNTKSIRTDKGRNIWDLQSNGERRNDFDYIRQTGSEGFQTNTARDNEYLRGSDKRKSSNVSYSIPDRDSAEAVINTAVIFNNLLFKIYYGIIFEE